MAMRAHMNFTAILVLEIWKAFYNINPPRLGLATFDDSHVQLRVSAIIHH